MSRPRPRSKIKCTPRIRPRPMTRPIPMIWPAPKIRLSPIIKSTPQIRYKINASIDSQCYCAVVDAKSISAEIILWVIKCSEIH